MEDFSKARVQMVDCQIRPNDVTDFNVIDAFLTLPREEFLPQQKRSIAYSDADLEIVPATDDQSARYLMHAIPFSKMVQAAEFDPADVVLCIASGSGYGAAIISKLSGSVVAIESDADLVARSSETLSDLGIDNVAVIEGDLVSGCPNEAPFDVIFIEGAIEAVPDGLFKQLRQDGRLVAIVGIGLAARLCVYRKVYDDISVTRYGNLAAPSIDSFQRAESFVF